MNSLNVSFEIITNECSLNQITNNLGFIPSASSVDKGARIYKNKIADKTIWKIVSDNEEYKTVGDHLKDIFTDDFIEKLSKPDVLPRDCTLYLNVAVFYTEFGGSCSVLIPSEYLKLFNHYKLDIEISFYPCSE